MPFRSLLRFIVVAGLFFGACSNPTAHATVEESAKTAPAAQQAVGSNAAQLPDPVPSIPPVSTTTSEPATPKTLTPLPDEPLLHLDAVDESRLTSNLEISAALWVHGHGEVWSYDPELELFPASTQKLFTGAGALNELGGEHTFRTEVRRNGPTLYLVAGGDPTLTGRTLDQLAKATVAALPDGTDMESLVVDVSRYENALLAPGWQDWQMPTYTGPLSALMLDDNRWTKSAEFVSSPAVGNGERFRDALRAAGLAIELPAAVGEVPETAAAVTQLDSAPVTDLVRAMLLSSDNQIAESLAREVAAVAGRSRATTSDGLATMQRGLSDAGIQAGGALGDGSGLSRSNRWSARQWLDFLVAARSAPWFEEFSASLPVAGRSGTLASRFGGTDAAGNIRAKTGTIIGGRALSGYFITANGDDAAFSITVNGDASHGALGLIDSLAVEMVEKAAELQHPQGAVPADP